MDIKYNDSLDSIRFTEESISLSEEGMNTDTGSGSGMDLSVSGGTQEKQKIGKPAGKLINISFIGIAVKSGNKAKKSGSSVIIMSAAGLIIMTVVLLLLTTVLHDSRSRRHGSYAGFPAAVNNWRGFVDERLELYNDMYPEADLTVYDRAILAIIWQESAGDPDGPGVNGDIMQCRESGYWTYQIPDDWDTLSEPEKSIDAGIRYFILCLQHWDVSGSDDEQGLQMVVQGYNFGYAFLLYAENRGVTEWSYGLALAYAASMGGNYGNPRYGEQWLEKYRSSTVGGSWVWPMPAGHEISSGFGSRWGETHRGIDIPCPIGSEVLASNGGTVVYVGEYGTGGNAVLIDCGDGMTNYYYHLSEFNVSLGDEVMAGEVIAFSGNTGRSTGPHLHFGVSIDGEYVDPMGYLNGLE